MQVFVPYPSPIDVAKCLDRRRLRKQIIECNQILDAIDGTSDAWSHHPIVKMYEHYYSWLHAYTLCLMYFSDGNIDMAEYWNECADDMRPSFLDDDNFCDQHKRRLYTKAPELYPQFAAFGKSKENWYYIDGNVVRYIDGKKL